MALGKMRLAALLLVSAFLVAYSHRGVEAQELTSAWMDNIAASLDMDLDMESSSEGPIWEGRVGECDEGNELMMDSDVHGRLLRRVRYYISYGALSANRVPCPPRSGRSYYTRNCYGARGPVHPYRRACTRITRCRRYTS